MSNPSEPPKPPEIVPPSTPVIDPPGPRPAQVPDEPPVIPPGQPFIEPPSPDAPNVPNPNKPFRSPSHASAGSPARRPRGPSLESSLCLECLEHDQIVLTHPSELRAKSAQSQRRRSGDNDSAVVS